MYAGRNRMVVGFTTTAYHHLRCEFESRSWRAVLETTVSGFLRVLRFPPPIKLTATIQLKYPHTFFLGCK